MLIDPQGLFYGERISACSDEAQLHFPRLMAAANGFGRIEMSVGKLHATVYAGFKVKPSKAELQKWFREYHANFLLFVYRAGTGEVWGQFAISRGKLPKYKTAEDNRSPAPHAEDLHAYLHTYTEVKRAKYAAKDDHIAILEDFRSLPKASETFKAFPHGEVEVVEEVEGIAPATPSRVSSRATRTPDPERSALHTDCRLAILAYWAKYVQRDSEPTWDGSEGKALADFLRALPGATVARVRRMLEHRGQSDVNPCERPRKWIPALADYELGPLDAFGKPKSLALRPKAGVAVVKGPTQVQTRAALQQEESERMAILADWRDRRQRGDAAEKEPAWVQRALDNEGAGEQGQVAA